MSATATLWPYAGDVIVAETSMGSARTVLVQRTGGSYGAWTFEGLEIGTNLPVWGWLDQIVEITSPLPAGYHATDDALTVGCEHNDGTVCDDTCLRDEVILVPLAESLTTEYETYWVSDPATRAYLRSVLAVYLDEGEDEAESIALVEQAVAVERMLALVCR
jgi:hypothetical protein